MDPSRATRGGPLSALHLEGVLASAYLTPAAGNSRNQAQQQRPRWVQTVRSCDVDATSSAANAASIHERVVEMSPDSGYATILLDFTRDFFSDAPEVSPDGYLSFSAAGLGGDAVVTIAVVDLADINLSTLEPTEVGRLTINVHIATKALLKRPTPGGRKAGTTPSPSSSSMQQRSQSPTATSTAVAVGGGTGPRVLLNAPRTGNFAAASTMPPPPRVMLDFSIGGVHSATTPSPRGPTSPVKGAAGSSAPQSPERTAAAASPSTLDTSTSAAGLRPDGSPEPQQVLAPPSIRLFRATPPRPTLRSFAPLVLNLCPMLLMRQWNYFAEYRLLTDARGSPEQAVALLKKIQTAMENSAVVEAVVPLIDAACRLHFSMGGDANIRTALRLGELRVQAVGTAFGLDMRTPNPIDVGTAQRLTSARPDSVELLVRCLVETAHLMKLTGNLSDALRYYKIAATVAGTQGASRGAGTAQIPFLFAAGDVNMLRGDIKAAVREYEQARAHAELASRGSSVVAECEQQLAYAFTLLGQMSEADIAIKRALSIRRDQKDSVALAEALLYEAVAHAQRGQLGVAASCVSKAREQAQRGGPDKAAYVRCVVEALAGTLLVVCRADNVEWDLAAAQQCADPCIRAFAAWLSNVERADPEVAVAEHAAVQNTLGSGSGLTSLLGMSAACALWSADNPERALTFADAALNALTGSLQSTNALLRLAVEIAGVCATGAQRPAEAQQYAERLVWMVNEATAPVSADAAFRISACVAEAATATKNGGRTRPNDDHSATTATEDASRNPFQESAPRMYAVLLETVGAVEGHFSPKLVPMLLDAAEVRHVVGDYSGALELFGKALRIVDSKNLLYLVGPIYLPRWMLTVAECRDRDRLVNDRHPGLEGMTRLAMLLQQIGLSHEAAGRISKANSALQQAVATFEMAGIEHHPGCLTAMVSLGRCLLSQKEHATARVYLERAEQLFRAHYHKFGKFVEDPTSLALYTDIQAALRAVMVSERATGALLCRGRPSNPELQALQLYV